MRVFTQTVGHAAPLTCYLLDASDEMSTAQVRPAVLVLPGGGYHFTSDREAEPVALAYLAEGFHACVLRYTARDDSTWDEAFDDAQAALGWIREHATEMRIDPDRVAAVGFSAGGHLGASLGTVEQPPNALILGYPVTLADFGPPIGKQILDIPSAVGPDYPPVFLFSTGGDTLVPIRNSLELLGALAERRVPFESHLYLLGPHGISLARPHTANGDAALVDPAVAGWFADSVRFLAEVFGVPATGGEPQTYATLLARREVGATAPVGVLLGDERAVAVLERHLPGLVDEVRANPLAYGLPLAELARFQPRITAPVLATLLPELEDLRGPSSS